MTAQTLDEMRRRERVTGIFAISMLLLIPLTVWIARRASLEVSGITSLVLLLLAIAGLLALRRAASRAKRAASARKQ